MLENFRKIWKIYYTGLNNFPQNTVLIGKASCN